MIKLGDLIQEIKVIPASSGLVYWPDLRKNLRKEFKRGYKIYNNLSEDYPSIKISFYLPGAAEPISDIDPREVYNYLTSFNARNWKFDLKKDHWGKDTIYAFPLDIPRGNEKVAFSDRVGPTITGLLNSYLSRLKDLGIYYMGKDDAWNSWIKHYPQGNLQEIKVIPAYSKVDIVKTLQKPENIKLLRSFIKDYFIDQYGIEEYRDYYNFDVYEVKSENIENINNITYLSDIQDTRKYQNMFYDINNIAYINFETYPYSIFTFESNVNFDYLRAWDYEYLGIQEGINDIIAINFDIFN